MYVSRLVVHLCVWFKLLCGEVCQLTETYFLLGVSSSDGSAADSQKHASMWVGNLPPGTKAKDVLDLLNPHGKVCRGLCSVSIFCFSYM